MYPASHRASGTVAGDLILLLFRIVISALIVIFRLLPEATRCWNAIWHEKSWKTADTIASFGVPQAQWVGAAALVSGFLATIGLGCGFVTRLSCLALLAGVGFSLYVGIAETEVELIEISLIYAGALFFFLANGPGNFSADHYFRGSSEKRLS